MLTLHIDTVFGDDAYEGTEERPVASYPRARALVPPLETDTTFKIHAPEDKPLVVWCNSATLPAFQRGGVRLTSDTRWYGTGAIETILGGWTVEANGVYSRPLVAAPKLLIDQTVHDDDGCEFVLMKVTGTPTPGTFSWLAGTLRVKLIDGGDANARPIIRGTENQTIAAASNAQVTVERAALKYAGGTFGSARQTSKLFLRDVLLAYAGESLVNSGGATEVPYISLEGVIGHTTVLNDGYSISGGGTLEARDCEVSLAQDKGITAHQNSKLIVIGGRYSRCSSGSVSVDNAQVSLNNVRLDHNRVHGLWVLNAVSATVNQCEMDHNAGCGIRAEAGTQIGVVGGYSGLDAGNGLADAL